MDDHPMSKEESYVERRLLFKNIWETAMQIEDKEDIFNKPKVIKTLRLSEVDKCPVGKTKKQRIKNLRHVCKKILDFCDKQDAEDKFYEQVAAAGQPDFMTFDTEPKKMVVKHRTKKVPKSKSMITRKLTVGFVTNSEAKNIFIAPFAGLKTSRPTSPLRVNTFHKHIKRKARSGTKPVMISKSPEMLKVGNSSKIDDDSGEPATRRKVSKKKRVKKKKKTDTGCVARQQEKTIINPRKLYSGM